MMFVGRDDKLRWLFPPWNIILTLLVKKARAQCHTGSNSDGGTHGDSDSDSDSDDDDSSSSSRTSSRAYSTQCSTSTNVSFTATGTRTDSGPSASDTVALLNNTQGDKLSGGSITGIVLGLLLLLLLLYFFASLLRKRFKKLKNLTSKSFIRRTEEQNAMLDSTPAGLVGAGVGIGLGKENGRHEAAESTDSHMFLPNPHPRDLPPLPPLSNDDVAPSMAQRNSIVLSYTPLSITPGNDSSTLERGFSMVSRTSSLHEDMIVHQKDLEANYGMAEGGEGASPQEPSGSRLAVIDEHPFEPPPQYIE